MIRNLLLKEVKSVTRCGVNICLRILSTGVKSGQERGQKHSAIRGLVRIIIFTIRTICIVAESINHYIEVVDSSPQAVVDERAPIFGSVI
jgi:hypothetical protein